MPLIVHRADRADVLADGLAGLLSEPPDDPFERDLVVVAAEGVQRWLAQTLSHRLGTAPGQDDGICAGIELVRPPRLLAELTEKDLQDPWSPERLAWTVLEVIDDALHEPWLEVVARHVGHGMRPAEEALRRGRRYSTARRTASLLHAYALQRPWMVQAWSAGHDVDGQGHDLPAECRWQAETWRRVEAALDRHPSPDARLAATATGLREGSLQPRLPQRLSFFGHTRMPAAELDVVAALSTHRQVHLWLPHPSRPRWQLVEDRVPTWGTRPARAEVDPPETGNTLLTTCARDAAELEIGLLGLEVDLEVEHLEPPARPSSLLGLLQSDLVADRPAQPGEPSERQVAADDRSVQVHACHGAARQVDVLREVVLGLLEDDPTLEPRDVLVMCPDVETFAPLVQAAFGLDDVEGVEHPGHQLRVRLADRATGSVNPVAEVLQRLVSIAAGGRTSATEVLDLLSLAPVRHRFALSDDDLDQLGTWVTTTGVRWGVDAQARSRWGLGGLAQNTWAAGLDRLALSVATEPGRPGEGSRLGGVLPVDDLGSSVVELVGRVTEATSRLGRVLDAASRPLDLSQWVALLTEAVQALTSTPARESWQVDQVVRALAGLVADQSSGRPGGTLGVVEVEAVLAHLLAPRPTRTSFRTGSLTVCTMVPMRSVPHRVVCLLGLESDTFPRTPTPLGDDVLARHPLVGERDAAAEDRQLFLDAILSATEHLVITYTGASEHTGRELPPATPVGELLDQLARTAPSLDVRHHVVTRHPLQSFDARSFTPGAVLGPGPFSFDTAALAGARTTQRPPEPAPPFLAAPVPPRSTEVVTLDQLRGLVAHPVRSFVREVLGVTLQREAEPVSDAIPLGLDHLQQWQLNAEILDEVLGGVTGHEAEADARRSGVLPPGALADEVLRSARETISGIYAVADPWRTDEARSVDVDLALPDGRRLVGTVSGQHEGHGLVVTPSRIGPKHLAAAWIDVLALAADPHVAAVPVHVVGRVREGRTTRAGVRSLRPPEAPDVLGHLTDLLDLWELGMTAPLPLPVKTSYAFAEALRRTTVGNAERIAEPEWVGNRNHDIDGEDADPYHVQVLGAGTSFARLVRLEVAGLGLHQLAPRLWNPLLDHVGSPA
ncbi:hypothetical protein ASD11_10010 [Aeromicrobium sp. Root495]|uniref:exodeoxyribonuclease V subunit gamma n=1 Tax=Aeromicrobium sp. Root495 TaxID=1736550 RepID=UPI0006FED7F8|nr:exodeoxyribonuclease V subunit gamma [Aeromicrobium sp. Root495]KQY59849.1 hypothetical protein ASD11_10010 [Aeromicrobium sp. Root495]